MEEISYKEKLKPYIEKMAEITRNNPNIKLANIVVSDTSKIEDMDINEIPDKLIQEPINFKTIDFDGGDLIISYDMYYPQMGIAFKYKPERYEILYDSHYDINEILDILLSSNIDIKSKLRIIRLLCRRVEM